MKISRKQTKKGWRIRLEHKGTIFQAEDKSLKEAMRKAFLLIDNATVTQPTA